MSVVITLLTVVLMVVSLLLVLLVLMQRPKQEGLGAAFGGGMTDQMFGAQTTNVLQKGTVWLAVLFFGISLMLAIIMARTHKDASVVPDVLKESDPVAAEQEAPATGDGPSVTIDPADVEAPAAPSTEGAEESESSKPGEGEAPAPAMEDDKGAKPEPKPKPKPAATGGEEAGASKAKGGKADAGSKKQPAKADAKGEKAVSEAEGAPKAEKKEGEGAPAPAGE